MCLILLGWRAHPDYPLIVAANRDEFHARPTEPAHFWKDAPFLLAGRDAQAGGTWMGVTLNGRFAALTNFREPETGSPIPETHSRGRLVSDFLMGSQTAESYLTEVTERADAYKAFNLICGTLADGLFQYSNRTAREPQTARPRRLTPGIWGLSNNLLDVPWPKVARGKSEMALALSALPRERPLFELLRDERIHPDDQLPRTGISVEWERVLSAAFVRAPHYGTRCSTVLVCDRHGRATFDEQSFLPNASPPVVVSRERYRFRLAGCDAS